MTIVSNEEKGSLGHVEPCKWPKWYKPQCCMNLRTQDRLEKDIMVLYSGPIAEKLLTGRKNHAGAKKDYQMAQDLPLCR